MPRTIKSKIRRVGNSMAVIIPKDILEEANLEENGEITLSILISKKERDSILREIAGIEPRTRPFLREKQDRV